MADSQKKTKIQPVKKKITQRIQTLLINYLEARTPELELSNFDHFQKFLKKVKQTEPSFNVNQPMGFLVKNQKNTYGYFFDLAMHKDDVKLFELILDLGLQDLTSDGLPLWTSLNYFKSNRCINLYLSKDSSKEQFARHFIAGNTTPLESAVLFRNIEGLKSILNHPHFDANYLSQEDKTIHLNILIHAADCFNVEAIHLLLDHQAPCFPSRMPTTAFDRALNGFLDYYSGCDVTRYFRAKIGLETQNVKNKNSSATKEVMTSENILNVFYALLNRTPQELNVHVFFAIRLGAQKIDIFSMLVEIIEAKLKVSPSAMKYLVDILLSVGPGLCFHELPEQLKRLYPNISHSVEIVMPIMAPNKKTSYIYSYSEYEKYLLENHQAYLPLGALTQYLANRLDRTSVENIFYQPVLKLQTLINTLPNDELLEKINVVRSFAAELPSVLLTPPLEALKMLSSQNNELEVNRDTVANILTGKMTSLVALERKMAGEGFFQKNEDDIRYIHRMINDNTYLIPEIYLHLIQLNNVFRQLYKTQVHADDLGTVRQSMRVFNEMANKVDFNTMMLLYHAWKIKKSSPLEIIDLVKTLLSVFDMLNKDNHLSDSKTVVPAYHRLNYFLNGMLVKAYSEIGNYKFAKKAFKQAMLILEGANNAALFDNAYQNILHQSIVTHVFQEVIYFGIMHMPSDMFHAHLCQVLKFERGMILSKPFRDKLAAHIKVCILNNQFSNVDELLSLLRPIIPRDAHIAFEDLVLFQCDQISLYLDNIELKIASADLSLQVNLDRVNLAIMIDFKEVDLTLSKIKQFFSIQVKEHNKVFSISEAHLLSEGKLKAILASVMKVNAYDAELKQRQQDLLTEKMARISLELESPSPTLRSFPAQSETTPVLFRREKVKKNRTDAQQQPDFLPLFTTKPTTSLINIHELKQAAGLDDTYSDLIMITSSYKHQTKRFVAIKRLIELEPFLAACHQFENEAGEWGVKSVNPYGVNQHGVKLYPDNKLKIKGSGSDRAVGVGTELEFKNKKMIIYKVDTVLSHKKADKVFKLQ
jgi:hypothetical protein